MRETTTATRAELKHSPATTSDIFTTRFTNPHTAIPDWLILDPSIRQEARHMAMVIIVLSKRPMPPTKEEIAEQLGVNPRTISRWLAELRAAQVVSYQQVGKRRLYVFHDPMTIIDPTIIDPRAIDPHAIIDRGINDRGDMETAPLRAQSSGSSTAQKGRTFRQRISDRSGGGGDPNHAAAQIQPDTNPRSSTKVLPSQITTDTGRWMIREGFNIASAYRFQHMPLEAAQADYSRRRDLGQHHGAVINAWSVELPEFDHVTDERGAFVTDARRAELRALYGDLFSFSGDDMPPESSDI
jgi:DNA-binding transcriptional ArsR family regulator